MQEKISTLKATGSKYVILTFMMDESSFNLTPSDGVAQVVRFCHAAHAARMSLSVTRRARA
eukprot:9303871-Pyramimonas_sp.AAC.1